MVRCNFKIFIVSVFLLFLVSFTPSLLADQKVSNQPSKIEVIQKTQKLQIPFIANDGQTDEEVKFYANTFGGTVFVTKEGEIVYSLPNNSPDVETQCLASLMHSSKGIRDEDGMLHDYHVSGIMHPASWIVGRGSKSDFQNHTKSTSSDSKNLKSSNSKSAIQNLSPTSIGETKSGVALREQFVGAKVKTIQGEDPSVTKVNYFKGKDPSKWKTNISTYDMVSLGDVYDGIELKLKAYGNNVEKLFCVKPGADPQQIKVRLSGVKDCGVQNAECGVKNPKSEFQNPKLFVNERGELEVETELGPVKFTKPVAYQEINGKRVDVECKYTIADCGMQNAECKTNLKSETQNPKLVLDFNRGSEIANPSPDTRHSSPIYCFTVASYDKTKDLIIDPLLASTFLGPPEDDGFFYDFGHFVTIDASGNVYVTGWTHTGGEDNVFDTSYYDVFISKLDGGLTSLLAFTFLGGSDEDWGNSLAIDTSGNVYVTGDTYSADFPTTTDAYDPSYNDSYEVFVSKLDGELTTLLASTYLGGSDEDWGNSLTLDTSGNIYVTGYTGSSDFPTTNGAYDTSFNGGSDDVFISKLNNELTNLLVSTYLGGNSGDYGYSLTFDTNGNIYVTGYTGSSDFPTTNGAYDTSFNGVSGDVFVSKLDRELTSLVASTYLGGNSGDDGYSLSLDTNGNVYVTGYTGSSDFPTTNGAYDTSLNVLNDVFVSKLNNELTSLLASTYLGGSDDDYVFSLTPDTSGNVYVTGRTWSADFPTTWGAYDTTSNGNEDVFVSKLDSGLTSLLASTYLGGSGSDSGNSLTLDTSGNVYVTGWTHSIDFPTTGGAYDTSYNGPVYPYNYHTYAYNVFVSKLDGSLSTSHPTVTTGNATNVSLTSATLNGIVNANGASTDVWFEYDTTSGSYSNTTSTQSLSGLNGTDTVSIDIIGLSPETKYYYRLAAQNSVGTAYGNEMSFTTLSLSKGNISGYVSDIKGNPIESVKLRLKGKKMKIVMTSFSNSDGFFEFTDLDADAYVITATKKGYKRAKRPIKLEEREEKEIEIVMKKSSKRAR